METLTNLIGEAMVKLAEDEAERSPEMLAKRILRRWRGGPAAIELWSGAECSTLYLPGSRDPATVKAACALINLAFASKGLKYKAKYSWFASFLRWPTVVIMRTK